MLSRWTCRFGLWWGLPRARRGELVEDAILHFLDAGAFVVAPCRGDAALRVNPFDVDGAPRLGLAGFPGAPHQVLCGGVGGGGARGEEERGGADGRETIDH